MHKLTMSGILFGGHLLPHLLHLLGLASLDLGKFLLRQVEPVKLNWSKYYPVPTYPLLKILPSPFYTKSELSRSSPVLYPAEGHGIDSLPGYGHGKQNPAFLCFYFAASSAELFRHAYVMSAFLLGLLKKVF